MVASELLKNTDFCCMFIPGFSRYVACSDGIVYRVLKSGALNEMLPERRKSDRRARITLKTDDGKLVRKYRAYFVLLAWVSDRPESCETLHGDGDCTNDRPINLRWGTPLENRADMLLHGTRTCGEDVVTAKLSEADVVKIREIRRSGMLLKDIGQMFDITETMVSLICRGKAWKHVS